MFIALITIAKDDYQYKTVTNLRYKVSMAENINRVLLTEDFLKEVCDANLLIESKKDIKSSYPKFLVIIYAPNKWESQTEIVIK